MRIYRFNNSARNGGASTKKKMSKNILDEILPPFKGNTASIIKEISFISEVQDAKEAEDALCKYWQNIPLTRSEWIALDKLSCTSPLPQDVLDAISDYFEHCFE